MSSYSEKPVYTDFNIALSRIGLFVIILLFCYELREFFNGGSVFFLLYALIFVMLWLWRCGFDYAYTISDSGIMVERTMFGRRKKVWIYPMDEIECVVLYFKRKLFQKDAVGKYYSRFSSIDANNVHLIILNENGSRKGIMIKSTDRFFRRIRKNHPDKVREMI